MHSVLCKEKEEEEKNEPCKLARAVGLGMRTIEQTQNIITSICNR